MLSPCSQLTSRLDASMAGEPSSRRSASMPRFMSTSCGSTYRQLPAFFRCRASKWPATRARAGRPPCPLPRFMSTSRIHLPPALRVLPLPRQQALASSAFLRASAHLLPPSPASIPVSHQWIEVNPLLALHLLWLRGIWEGTKAASCRSPRWHEWRSGRGASGGR